MTDLFAGLPPEPAHHAGRKPHEPKAFKDTLPAFAVLPDDVAVEARMTRVDCSRCGGQVYVVPEDMPPSGEARPCFFCWKSSRLP